MDFTFSIREVALEVGLRIVSSHHDLEGAETLAHKGIALADQARRTVPPSIPLALRGVSGTPKVTLESVELAPEGGRKTAFYLSRGDFLYPFSQAHFIERVKTLFLPVILILGNLFIRVLIQGVAYHFFKAVHLSRISDFLNKKFFCEHAARHYSYLKAFPAIAVHLALFIISLATSLLPNFPLLCNYFHGDIERWTVGHITNDLTDKSLGARCHEAFYIARCVQPETFYHLPQDCSIIDITVDPHIKPSPQRALIRQITQENYHPSLRPLLFEDGIRVSYSPLGLARDLTSRILGIIGQLLDSLIDFPLELCHRSHKAGDRRLPPTHKILFINGMHNEPDWVQHCVEMISLYGESVRVTNVYNHTRGLIADAWKYLWAARRGFTPSVATSRIVRAIKKFHHKNLANPDAKMLIFTHSGGAIELRNALDILSREELDRLICVNLAPSTIIDPSLCEKTTHYALYSGSPTHETRDRVPLYAAGNRPDLANQITWLPSTGNIHTIVNPAFAPIIKRHIRDYLATLAVSR